MKDNILRYVHRNNQKVVYARELYAGLGLTDKQFPRWANTHIISNKSFKENKDWFRVNHIPECSKNKKRKFKLDDYAINLKMARSIVLALRSELDYTLFEKYHTVLINMDGGLGSLLKDDVNEFVNNLSFDPRRLQSQLITHVTFKNVDEIIPLLLERIEEDLVRKGKGKAKLSLLNSISNALKVVSSKQTTLAKKDIIMEQLFEVIESYRRTAHAKKAGDSKVTGEKFSSFEGQIDELSKQLEEKQKVIDSLQPQTNSNIQVEMKDLRKKINNSVKAYAMNSSFNPEDIFLELYDQFYFKTGIDIVEDYSKNPSYLLDIQSKGDVEVLRELYKLARNILK